MAAHYPTDDRRAGATWRQRRAARLAARPTMPAWLTALVVVAGSALVTCMCLLVQAEGSPAALAGDYLAHPAVFLANALVTLDVAVAVGAVFASAFGGLATAAIALGALNLANVIKVELRDEPVSFADLGLLHEAGNAAGSYDVDLHPPLIALIAVVAVVLIVLAGRVRSWHPASRAGRAGAALAGLAACAALFPLAFSNDAVYQGLVEARLDSTQQYNFSAVCRSVGFNYYFAHTVSLESVTRPDGYSAREVQGWVDEHGAQGASGQQEPGAEAMAAAVGDVRPNLVFVMCESFTDLSAEPEFAYSPADDPLHGYRQVLASDETLVSGHIVVSNFGGGTANTEFDVMTGMKANFISDESPTAFYDVRRPTSSLFRVAEDAGYATAFMHPGYSWFYNRANVYRWLGVQSETFSEAFSDADMLGGWVTDSAFLRQLEGDFASMALGSGAASDSGAGDAPLLYSGVTIQNHLQYDYGKYVYKGTEDYDPVPLNVEISGEAMEPLAVYLRGVRDSSDMLLGLTTYLDGVDEPTLLVFYGDHRPNLGNDFGAYRELGSRVGLDDTPEDTILTYSTPYVVWANRAWRSRVDVDAALAALDLPTDGLMSDNYLGSVAYQLAGMGGTDAYFDFLVEARSTLPVICSGCYRTPDGTYTTELDADQLAVVDKMHKWEYYRLVDETVAQRG
ncbi:MAG: LTA synthase family protein [Coriobacteriales bacterium]|jgi:hypothetical protein